MFVLNGCSYLRERDLNTELGEHGSKLVEVDKSVSILIELSQDFVWCPLREICSEVRGVSLLCAAVAAAFDAAVDVAVAVAVAIVNPVAIPFSNLCEALSLLSGRCFLELILLFFCALVRIQYFLFYL